MYITYVDAGQHREARVGIGATRGYVFRLCNVQIRRSDCISELAEAHSVSQQNADERPQ